MIGRTLSRRIAALSVSLLGLVPLFALAPTAAAAPDTDPTTAVTITVVELDPKTITPDATITVAGTLTNTTDRAISQLALRLQRGGVLLSREVLGRNDTEPSSATSGFGDFAELPGELAPGATRSFRYQTTVAKLGLRQRGVYPALVNLNGVPDGDVEQRVGQIATLLPYFPELPAASTAVAWLWPLIDRPHRDAAGDFVDDELATAVDDGGRLDRLLSAAEQAAEEGAGVPLTLAVDPLLLADLTAMSAADGYRVTDGSGGSGADAARSWLLRLRVLAQTHSVIALPYGDADTVALTRAGLTATVTAAQTAGRQLVADTLNAPLDNTLTWPVGGVITDADLQVLQATGIEQVVLSGGSFDQSGNGLPTTVIATPTGLVTALVTDPTVDELVAAAATATGGPRLGEQRYLAELALIAGDAGAGQLLIAPPRRWDPQTSAALSLLTDTTTEPWLRAAAAPDLLLGPRSERGTLRYSAQASQAELAGDPLTELVRATSAISDLRSMLLGASAAEISALTQPVGTLSWQAASSWWREDPDGFGTAAAAVTASVQSLRESVSLVVPATGAYSLASASAPLVFTVANDLPIAVQVRLVVDSSAAAGLTTGDIGLTTLPPNSRTPVEVPTTVERSGEFRVTASISTPAGGTLGAPVQLTVRSSAYGAIALIITIGAGALLALLFLLRLVRRIRAGRARRAAGAVVPAEQVPLSAAEQGAL